MIPRASEKEKTYLIIEDIDFFLTLEREKTFIKYIISKPIETKRFKIFTPKKAKTVEEAIEEFLNNN